MKKIYRIILIIVLCSIYTINSNAQLHVNETVTFFPTFAHITPDNIVHITIHGWIYKPKQRSLKRRALLKLFCKAAGMHKGDADTLIFRLRSRHFLVDNKREKKVRIEFTNRIYHMSESESNGHFRSSIPLQTTDLSTYLRKGITYRAVTARNDPRVFTGRVCVIGQKGISVISDIDDTIKISNVLNKRELVRNTFFREFRPAPGMTALYRKWKLQGASFHYVSGSPWQLYIPIANFMKKYDFPEGSIHLKHFRLKDSSTMRFIIADQITYKTRIIESIIIKFPLRRFILVGDSGEHDPEIYGRIAKKFTKQIHGIFIRDVGDPSGDPSRYTKLFKDLPIVWKVFKDPGKIRIKIR